jgi:hypothetical protein
MLAAGGEGIDALISAEVFLFEDFHPALHRAWREVEEGTVGFVNVKSDDRARATTLRFSSRET